MLNQKEILSTIEMIDQQHLDIRTITMGISLLSCCDPDLLLLSVSSSFCLSAILRPASLGDDAKTL